MASFVPNYRCGAVPELGVAPAPDSLLNLHECRHRDGGKLLWMVRSRQRDWLTGLQRWTSNKVIDPGGRTQYLVSASGAHT